MKLFLNWHSPMSLGKYPYGVDISKIPECAGIYIFLRTYGEKSEAKYVGKATNLRIRINQQFNNRKLMDGIREDSKGRRRLVFAEFVAKPGQKITATLPLCEKTLIRYYLAQGHDLLNYQGTQLKFHELDSQRSDLRSFLPLRAKLQIH